MAEQMSPFVPSGVDAGTWMGFEDRIRNRRFAALIDQFDQAVSDDDRDAAQAALDEARELRPGAPEVLAAAERLALLHALPAPIPEAHAWSRVIGAVALLLIGVSLLVGLDWMRMPPPVPVAPPSAATPALGNLNIPELVVVRPAPPAAALVSAPVAPPATTPHSPTGWTRVLRLFGVEVIRDTPTNGVRVRRAI
jgi:hypothetical protein